MLLPGGSDEKVEIYRNADRFDPEKKLMLVSVGIFNVVDTFYRILPQSSSVGHLEPSRHHSSLPGRAISNYYSKK